MKSVHTLVDKKLVERLNHVDGLTKLIFAATGLAEKKHQLWVIKEVRKITLFTDDSILATRLRLDQQQIINYINNHSAFIIDSLQIKMTMPIIAKRENRRTTFKMSKQSAKTITSIAESIEDDELKESLLRISKLGSSA